MRRAFWRRVVRDGDCWIWTGHKNRCGYGRLTVDGRRIAAHRLAYELLVGPVPDGLELDHLCRNRACVRPSHLEPVTHRENTLRGDTIVAAAAAATACPQGHAYDEANTYRYPDGRRDCRTCRADRRRRHLQRAA